MLKVLIVDDTRTIRHQLKQILEENQYTVSEATDGVDALTRVKVFKPHIVLMDIMMPNMDGIECCRRIKGDPETRSVKVIMVTTKGEYQKVNEAFKARCDDYITKPVRESELTGKLKDISKLVRASMTLRSL